MILKGIPNFSLLTLMVVGLILFINQNIYSQSLSAYIPPSPNASALGKYANVPVNLYTGIPEINIPLYSLPYQGGSVPLALSYHASAIKVQDVASNIGLGWSMNSGGAITRIVRGLPDEDANGYCGADKAGNKISATPSKGYIYDIEDRKVDSEPDMFMFNIMGMTGRFILDVNGNPVMIPYQDVQITPGIGPLGDGNWKIVDNSGMVYLFKKDAQFIEKTRYKLMAEGNNKYKTFISTWYLSEIRKPDGQLAATFTYEGEGEIYYILYSWIHNYALSGLISSNKWTDTSTDIRIASRHISEMKTSFGSVSFQYASRKDLESGQKLISMSIFNYTRDKVLKKYNFNQDYFISVPPVGKATTDQLTHRLKLVSIEIESEGHKSLYNTFKYETGYSLPPRYTNEMNAFGHFGSQYNRFGAHTSADMMTKIINSTGGETSFSYEGHQYTKTIDNRDYRTLTSGVRIAKIIEDDKNGHVTTKEFKYVLEEDQAKSSGLIFRELSSTSSYQQSNGMCWDGRCGTWYDTYVTWYSYSPSDNFDLNGASIGYSCVYIFHNNGSKEIKKFTNFNTNPDIAPILMDAYGSGKDLDGYRPTTDKSNINGAPFTPSTSRAWERGLLTEHKMLDGDDNVVNYTKNYYTPGGVIRSVPAMCVAQRLGTRDQGSWGHVFGRYSIESGMIFLTKSEEQIYDQKSNSDGVRNAILTTTLYEYTFPNKLYKTTTSTLGNPKKYITQLIYPEVLLDDPATPLRDVIGGLKDIPTLALANMVAKHMTGNPVEKITYVKEGTNTPVVTSAELTVFGNYPADPTDAFDDTRALPSKKYIYHSANGVSDFSYSKIKKTLYQTGGLDLTKYVLDLDPRYKLVSIVDKYNPTKDVPLQVSTKDGYKTSYIWGYEENLVIAKVDNATNNEIVQLITPVPAYGVHEFITQPTLHFSTLPGPSLDHAQDISFTFEVSMAISPDPNASPPLYNDPYIFLDLKDKTGKVVHSFNFTLYPRDPNAPNKGRSLKETITVSLPAGEYSFFYESFTYADSESDPIRDYTGLHINITAPYKSKVYFRDVFHTSFEEDGTDDSKAKTGKKSLISGSYIVKLPPTAGQYVLSWWEKTTTNESWTYKEQVITNNGSAASQTISANFIDEVRLYPVGAFMTTYTYDPLIGVTSETDANNITTYYLYDEFGRLEYVKDSDGNIIKNNVYKLVTDSN